MLYMVIEDFHKGKTKQLYERFSKKGRILPDDVRYIDSWINEEVTRCFQLMETGSRRQLDEWIDQWKDLADFEVIPVISSAEAARRVAGENPH